MAQYLPLLILLLLSIAFVAFAITVNRLVAPKRAHAAKQAPYECGIIPVNKLADRFPVRFYLVAMIFVIFDIEVIFLYPWAVESDALKLFGFTEVAVFSGVAIVCLAYLLSNGALDWGTRNRREYGTDPSSTIRYVHKPVVVEGAETAEVVKNNGA